MKPSTITLRCQTVIDGRLYWALVPVDRVLWATGQYAQDHARRAARKELRYRAVKHIGRELTDIDFDGLPVWVEYPDRCDVECVGGPHDGKTMTVPEHTPPGVVRLPIEEGPDDVLDQVEEEPGPNICAATYVPLLDGYGFFRRSPSGAWQYAHSH